MIKPKFSILFMKPYEPPLNNRKGKLCLDFNENTIGCSPKVLKTLKENLSKEKISMYPQYKKFKEKLSSFLKVKQKEILLTNGADEAIQVLMNTYLDKNDEVIILKPTFSLYENYASLFGAKIKFVSYGENLTFPLQKLLKKISSKTKIVVLANPNNPTGTIIKKRGIEKILKKAKNSLVVIDEAYSQYYGKSSKKLIEKYNNLAIIQTFSKAFGLAGLRLGYIISNEKIIKNLKKAISPYSVNNFAIIAASAALEDINFVENYVQEIKKNKILLEKELKKLGIKTFPSKTNFLLADFGNLKKRNFVYEKLKERGILVRKIDCPTIKNCLRITIGTKEQTILLVNEVKDILRKNILLFDMDGVLVDVSKSYRLAIKKTAEYFTKKKISFEEIQKLKEKGNYNNDWALTEKIISQRNVKIPKNRIIKKFQDFYLKNRKNERFLFKKKILQELYKKYKLGIVTGRPKEEAHFMLKKNSVFNYFDIIVTMEDVPKEKQKPNPYGIKLALKKLKYKSNNDVVYFGDCVDDMKAAKSINIKAIGVILPIVSSKNLKSLLKKEGADFVIKNINEFLEVILRKK